MSRTHVHIKGETVIAILRTYKWRKKAKEFMAKEVVVFT